MAWIGLVQDRDRCRSRVYAVMNLREICSLFEDLLVSQERICFMDLVSCLLDILSDVRNFCKFCVQIEASTNIQMKKTPGMFSTTPYTTGQDLIRYCDQIKG